MEAIQGSLRFFVCACCQQYVHVCQCCDRGQIYCSEECSEKCRKSSQRQASKRYQNTRNGAINHARRQSRYRANNQIVTHQGSAPVVSAAESTSAAAYRVSETCLHLRARPPTIVLVPVCHFCGRMGTGFIRRSFLTTRRRLQ